MNETETGVVLRVRNRGLRLNAFGTCSMDQYQLARFQDDIFSTLNKLVQIMHPVKKSTFSSCPSLRLERRQVLCVEISALKQQRKAIKEQLRESAKQAKKMAKRRKKLMKAQVCVFNRSFRLFRL